MVQSKNGLYGHERLHQYLLDQGYNMSQYMVRNIREMLGIHCVILHNKSLPS